MITTERLEKLKSEVKEPLDPESFTEDNRAWDSLVDHYYFGLRDAVDYIDRVIHESKTASLPTIGSQIAKMLPSDIQVGSRRDTPREDLRTLADATACQRRLRFLNMISTEEDAALSELWDFYYRRLPPNNPSPVEEKAPEVSAQGIGDILKLVDPKTLEKLVVLLEILDVDKLRSLMGAVNVDSMGCVNIDAKAAVKLTI